MGLFKLLLGAGAVVLAGCDPSLPLPHATGDGLAGSGGAPPLAVTAEPAAPLDALPSVARLRITGAAALDPAAVALVRGPLGAGQLREITQRRVSATLAKRVVPALTWREDGALVLAPTVPLDAGQEYTLAAGEAVSVRIAAADPVPLLRRVWPPEGGGGPAAFAVWCGDDPLPRFEAAVRLAPEGPEGRIRRGALDGGAGEHCLRFEGRPAGDGRWVPPASVAAADDPAVMVRLEPAPIAGGAAGTGVPALACETDEIAFGPGCARVADDRLSGRSPAVPLLWAVAGGGVDQVFAAGAGDPFAIGGLPPATDVTLDVAAIDERGTVLRMLLAAVTTTPMAHVILNEVLANPLGPEPAAEWVEIVNDGRAPVDLAGYALVDGGGETPLPAASLAPGAFALIVNASFSEQDGADPCPAPGTLILRVPHLGKNGLSNAGEALALRDAHGGLVSRFPAAPKPKAGWSVARRAPLVPDGAKDGFALATPSPGRTNVF
jgi:hypothetical protein